VTQYVRRGSKIALAGGMRDLAFFSGWYSGFKQKTVVGSGNFNFKRERDFVFLWGWDARFARGKERDTGFQFCFRFQVMNSNGSVPCQVLSNIFIIARLYQTV